MKTLTEICERFRLRKEKKNLESFFDSIGGFNSMCTGTGYLGWGEKNKPDELKLKREGSSWKIYNEECGGAPLVRYDEKPHEFGNSHLQYGEKLFTGRVGNEAADIMATILVANPNIRFPGESNEDVKKRHEEEIIANFKKSGAYY